MSIIKKYSFTVTSDEGDADAVGSLITIENVCTLRHPHPKLKKILVEDLSSACPVMDCILFDASPASTTATDNNPMIVNDADLTKIINYVPLATLKAFDDNSVLYSADLDMPVEGDGSFPQPLYAWLMLRAAAPNDWLGTKYVTFIFDENRTG